MKDEHFRVEVLAGSGEFEVRVFDLLDHGPDTPYAVVHSGTLDQALAQACHYMLVADNEPDALRLDTQRITATCRENRGADGAWAEAILRLRKIYDVQRGRFPEAELRLSIERNIPHPDPELPRRIAP